MKIVLDNIIYSNIRQSCGVSNYWFELSKYLLKKDQDEVLFYEEREAEFNFHRKLLTIPENQLIINPNSSKSSAIRRLSSVKLDISDYFLFHSSYYRSQTKAKNFAQITTVHDFTHNYFLNYFKRQIHNNLKYTSIKKSNGIICISESTYNDLNKFCPPRKDQKVTIINNGVSDIYRMTDRQDTTYIDAIGVKGPYLLYIGSRVHYKNFNFAVELLKETPNLQLVVVGGKFSAAELKMFDQDVLSRTITVSNVSDENLNMLYNFAHAFIYPSSYEGFGIPIIEAMRAGCPVLALRNSSIIEVSGDAGILFEQPTVAPFKKALDDLYNPDFRQAIVQKGLGHSSKYSWEKCSRETYEFYQEVY